MDPSMRLKVRGDTFFVPSSDGSVYFRNNIGSFRMEGSTIAQWIEKLIPVFNGENSMHDLTDGLPNQYREHVYEIAKVLYANGYVQDVSQDHPHQLDDGIVKRYAAQIEFLDSMEGSGAYRFEQYRQSSVLVVGAGSFLISAVKSLLESGLPKLDLLITNRESTNCKRIKELEEHYRLSDQEVRVSEIHKQHKGDVEWSSVVQPFDAIFFVSAQIDEGELKALNEVCRTQNKVLLPAFIMGQVGIVVPLSYPEMEGDWHSAKRRLQHSAIYKDPTIHTTSSIAESLLANVIVFEWLKMTTEATKSNTKNKLFMLNLETLEGRWHPFLPHPLATNRSITCEIVDFQRLIEQEPSKKDSSGLFPYFSQITSTETGIFHSWDEGELRQLPLSQCRVQPVDPLSDGPSALLPEIVCTGINHEEARREAGLAGIEAYVSRLANTLVKAEEGQIISVGVGETTAESIYRGLQSYLTEVMHKENKSKTAIITRVSLGLVEDHRCRSTINALTAIHGEPLFGVGDYVFGFPVMWVATNGYWYHAVDLNQTLALRRVLQFALQDVQNKTIRSKGQEQDSPSVSWRETKQNAIIIVSCELIDHQFLLKTAIEQLKSERKQLWVYDLTTEAFLKEQLAGAFGISLREEDEE